MKKMRRIVITASVVLMFGAALLAMAFLIDLEDSITIARNQEVIGNREVIPVTTVEGGLSGPFSLSLEVTETGRTVRGILVIKLEPGYSLVNLDFEPYPLKLLLVYKTPEGIIETANWRGGLTFGGIQVKPEKIKVVEGQ